MRSFKYRCPNPDCRAILSIPEKTRGHTARCAKCDQSFFVPFVLQHPNQTKPPLRKAG